MPLGAGCEAVPGQPPGAGDELLLAGRGVDVHATRYHSGRGRVKRGGWPGALNGAVSSAGDRDGAVVAGSITLGGHEGMVVGLEPDVVVPY